MKKSGLRLMAASSFLFISALAPTHALAEEWVVIEQADQRQKAWLDRDSIKQANSLTHFRMRVEIADRAGFGFVDNQLDCMSKSIEVRRTQFVSPDGSTETQDFKPGTHVQTLYDDDDEEKRLLEMVCNR